METSRGFRLQAEEQLRRKNSSDTVAAVINCLQNRRVVSLAMNVPGPVAAAGLRDMGASILKIEPPDGDPLAASSPEWYAEINAGMEIRRVDLKSADGASWLAGQLASADLLLTSSRPASLARLGLRRPEVSDRYRQLCWVAIVGAPAPRQEVPGHDLTYQAAHGLVDPPALPRTLISDLAGAQQSVIAALALLLARERGEGAGYAEVALEDAARLFANPIRHGLTSQNGALGGGLAIYNVYQAQDGWVAVGALEPHFRRAIGAALGVDSSDRDALAKAFGARTALEWQTWAEDRDLPIVAVRRV
jgi:crotonobetainyl-CoA:carnitine CoA-transferase CaiB-like acyl-CoA transferase